MANKIQVSTEWLEKCARDLQQINNAISQTSGVLSGINLRRDEGGSLKVSVNCALRMNGGHYSGSTAADDIRALEQTARALSAAAGRFSSGVSQGAKIFEDTEKAAAGLFRSLDNGSDASSYQEGEGGSGGSEKQSSGNEAESGDPKWQISWWKIIKTGISSAGTGGKLIGETIDIVKKLATGEGDLWDLGKYFVKTGSTVAKWADWHKDYKKLFNFGKDYGREQYLKKFFGLDKYLKNPSQATNKWTAFKKNFGDDFKSSITSKSTWIVKGITNGVTNIQEGLEKHYTGDRIAVEWATETAADVLIGAGATALTGAALAAAGVAAPAVVVAAVGGLAVCGVDWVVKNTIGGGEYGLIDGIGHLAGEAYEKTIGPSIRKGVNDVKNWFTDKVSVGWKAVFA